ncbi:hypothetical protein SAMN04244575_06382 [Sinorhizobium meliloti]|nr:hypothetical protein SAMN04244575_06382 [Sinorhizobium meliloti]
MPGFPPAPFKERRHLPCYTTPGDRGVWDRCQTFARHVIDDVEHTEPPSAGELVVYEIQRPAGIGFSLDEDRRTRAAGTPSGFRLRTESASLRYSR